MAEVLVAFGGNIGDARKTIARAIEAFCKSPLVQLRARSSDYRTPPWGVTEQPPFINAGIAVTTFLSPHDLLARARDIETQFGRDRSKQQRWGPRAIDIDLIAYDDVVLDDDTLTLPHPRTGERAFVLVPLAEIAPGYRIGAETVRDLLARVDTTGIEKLP